MSSHRGVNYFLRKVKLTRGATLSALVKMQALSNETRFRIVNLVREREMAAGTIARRFKLTRPAVSQHITVLREAGLLDERRVGSKRLYVVKREGFDELAEFIEGFWRPRLRRLKQAAEASERSRTTK
jgi:DNA-binding transcriptional ArsR family regulator